MVSHNRTMNSERNFPSTPKRAPRTSLSLFNTPRRSPRWKNATDSGSNETGAEQDDQPVILTKSFYTSSSTYLNPYERKISQKSKTPSSVNRKVFISSQAVSGSPSTSNHSKLFQDSGPSVNPVPKNKLRRSVNLPKKKPNVTHPAPIPQKRSLNGKDSRDSTADALPIAQASVRKRTKPIYMPRSPKSKRTSSSEDDFGDCHNNSSKVHEPSEGSLKNSSASPRYTSCSANKQNGTPNKTMPIRTGQDSPSRLIGKYKNPCTPEKIPSVISGPDSPNRRSSRISGSAVTPVKSTPVIADQDSPNRRSRGTTVNSGAPNEAVLESSGQDSPSRRLSKRSGTCCTPEKTTPGSPGQKSPKRRFFKNRSPRKIAKHLQTVFTNTGIFGDQKKKRNYKSEPKANTKKLKRTGNNVKISIQKKKHFTKLRPKSQNKRHRMQPKPTGVKPKPKTSQPINEVSESPLPSTSSELNENPQRVVNTIPHTAPKPNENPRNVVNAVPHTAPKLNETPQKVSVVNPHTTSKSVENPQRFKSVLQQPTSKPKENPDNATSSNPNTSPKSSPTVLSANSRSTAATPEGQRSKTKRPRSSSILENIMEEFDSVELLITSSSDAPTSKKTILEVIDSEKTDFEGEKVASPRRSPRRNKENAIPPATQSRLSQQAEKLKTKLFPIFSQPSVVSSNNGKEGSSPERSMPPSKKLKLLKDDSGMDQLIIDAGQKNLGPKICATCGMLYSTCSSDDVNLHLTQHALFLGNLRFLGWKTENVVNVYPEGRVILVRPSDPSYMIRKVQDVRSIVDRDLGFVDQALPSQDEAAFLLFVSSEKRVIGCLIAESITKGFELLPPKGNGKTTSGAFYCSEQSVPVLCGISRIWTAPKWRRKKIATRLLDCLRLHFIQDKVLSLSDFAFSAPTMSGQSFAEMYTRRKNYLVYK